MAVGSGAWSLLEPPVPPEGVFPPVFVFTIGRLVGVAVSVGVGVAEGEAVGVVVDVGDGVRVGVAVGVVAPASASFGVPPPLSVRK